jgi:hypothetical protein
MPRCSTASKTDRRIDVAHNRTGTNVPDSVTAAVNRESPNIIQGIVVFSDGRSNLPPTLPIANCLREEEDPGLHGRGRRRPANDEHQYQ